MGDDVNDLAVMREVGLSAAPADAAVRGARPGLHGHRRAAAAAAACASSWRPSCARAATGTRLVAGIAAPRA